MVAAVSVLSILLYQVFVSVGSNADILWACHALAYHVPGGRMNCVTRPKIVCVEGNYFQLPKCNCLSIPDFIASAEMFLS